MFPRRSHQTEWISTDTLHKVQERKKKEEAVVNSCGTRAAKACGEYVEENTLAKRSARADKCRYVDSLAEEAEAEAAAAASNNMREQYDITMQISNYSLPERLVKDKEGNSIPGAEH